MCRLLDFSGGVSTPIPPLWIRACLGEMYVKRLHELVCTGDSHSADSDSCKFTYVHKTRLRERILCHFPQMEAQKVGKSYLVLYSENVGDAVRTACETDYDDDALSLSEAVKIVRGEMLKHSYLFEGTFKNNCQEDSVPHGSCWNDTKPNQFRCQPFTHTGCCNYITVASV